MSGKVAFRFRTDSFDQYFNLAANVVPVNIFLPLPLKLLQFEKARALLASAHVVFELRCRRARTLRVLKHIEPVIAGLLNQRHGIAKIRFRLAGKPDDDITGDGDLPPRILDLLDTSQIISHGMTTPHRPQNAITARLGRQMYPVTQVFMLVNRGYDVWMKIARKGGGELDPFHPGGRDRAQQTRERCSSLK